MPGPDEPLPHFDELANLPPLARENYEAELDCFARWVRNGARVLQVGSHDGTRAEMLLLRLQVESRTIDYTGLEIEPSYVAEAEQRLAAANLLARFVRGDIIYPPKGLPTNFDVVVSGNNTSGWISEQERFFLNARGLGRIVIVSVFGEQFEPIAPDYFAATQLVPTRRVGNTFEFGDDSAMQFYMRDEVEAWVQAWGGKIAETPLGYRVQIPGEV